MLFSKSIYIISFICMSSSILAHPLPKTSTFEVMTDPNLTRNIVTNEGKSNNSNRRLKSEST